MTEAPEFGIGNAECGKKKKTENRGQRLRNSEFGKKKKTDVFEFGFGNVIRGARHKAHGLRPRILSF